MGPGRCLPILRSVHAMKDITSFSDLVPGRRVKRISYELLSWEARPAEHSEVDSVATAVSLLFDDWSLARFHWLMQDPLECLTVGPWQVGEPTPDTRQEDVSSRWRIQGARLVNHEVSL